MYTMTQEFYDETRTVIVRDADGGVTQRSYTAEENAAADGRTVSASNETALQVDAVTQLDVLLTSIATLKVVTDKANADIGPADTKTVAREARRVALQVVRLTRLLLNVTDSVDAGAAE